MEIYYMFILPKVEISGCNIKENVYGAQGFYKRSNGSNSRRD